MTKLTSIIFGYNLLVIYFLINHLNILTLKKNVTKSDTYVFILRLRVHNNIFRKKTLQKRLNACIHIVMSTHALT